MQLSEFLLLVEGDAQPAITDLAKVAVALEATERKAQELNVKLEQQAAVHASRMNGIATSAGQRAEAFSQNQSARLAALETTTAQRVEQSAQLHQSRLANIAETQKARMAKITRSAADEEESIWSGMHKKVLGGMESFWAKGLGIAKLGVAALGISVAAIGVGSVTLGAHFDAAMTMIHTQAGAFNEDLSAMGNQLLALAPKVGQGPDALAAGLYHLESAGFRGQVAIDAVTHAANLASMGNAGMEETSQALVGTLAAYPEYMGRAGDAAAILNGIVGTGDMRMEKFAQALATGILPAAKNFGVSLTDVGAALATLTDNVTPADEAATRLRMTMALMAAPSKAAASHLADIGMTASQMGAEMRKPNGMLLAVGDLRAHLLKTFGPAALDEVNKYNQILKTEGVDAANSYADAGEGAARAVSKIFGGGRSSAAMETLLGEYDRFSSKYGQIAEQSRRYDQDIAETHRTLAFQASSAKASIEAMGIRLGQYLAPAAAVVFSVINDKVLPAMERFGGWMNSAGIPALQKFGGWIGDHVVPVVRLLAQWAGDHLVPAFVAIGAHIAQHMLPQFAKWAAVLAPIVGIILVLVGVILDKLLPILLMFWAAVSDYVIGPLLDLVKTIEDHAAPAVMWLADKIKIAADKIKTAWDAVVRAGAVVIQWFKDLPGHVGGVIGWFTHAWDAVASGVEGAFNAVKDTIARVIDDILAFIKDHWRVLILITGPFGIIVDILTKHWGQIIGGFRRFIGWVAGLASEIGNAIKAFLQPLADIGKQVLDFFSGAALWLYGTGSAIIGGLWSGITTAIKDVWSFFGTVAGIVIGFFASAMTWLYNAGKAVLQGLGDGVMWVWNSVVHPFFVGIKTLVLQPFGDAIAWLQEKGKAILQGLGDGVGFVWNSLIGPFFAGIKGKAIQPFGDALNWLKGVGGDIMHGLWSGITSVFDFGGRLVGLVKQAWSDVISFLGIGSPSKLFAEVGGNIIGGLVKGITDNGPKIAKALAEAAGHKLGDVAGAAFSPATSLLPVIAGSGVFGGSVGGFAGGNVGGHTFHTYVTNPAPTPDEISAAMAWRMRIG